MIFPLLMTVLLFPSPPIEMPSKKLPDTVMVPALVACDWSCKKIPLILTTLIAAPGRTFTVTLVLPVAAPTRVGSGFGAEVSQVVV